MKYSYTVCCGKEINRKARRFPKLYWCRECRALHSFRILKNGNMLVKVKHFGRLHASAKKPVFDEMAG